MALNRDETESLRRRALEYHRRYRGKIEVINKVPLADDDELSLAYTPGVAEPCREISDDPDRAYDYTGKSNVVAIVTDGTAVLGLGDIGPHAALPVMEGKSLLMKGFAGIDGFPLCLDTRSVDRIVSMTKALTPGFGAVNLEDISAPRCFAIERRLKEETEVPIFHDDQHGTAIVTLGALLNALHLVDKDPGTIRVVINGAGAAGTATAELLLEFGIEDVVLLDSRGVIYPGRAKGMNPFKERIARRINPGQVRGSLAEALKGADVFIGLSVADLVDADMVRSMAGDPIIMAMANPVPEIYPEAARSGGAAVVATGRSDFPNQINNVNAFPGLLRGVLDVRAREINVDMKKAAARALADLVAGERLTPAYITPSPWDHDVAPAVAAAVAQAAIDTGVARIAIDPQQVAQDTRERVARAQRITRRTGGETY